MSRSANPNVVFIGTTSLFSRHAIAGLAREFTYQHHDAMAQRPAASEGESCLSRTFRTWMLKLAYNLIGGWREESIGGAPGDAIGHAYPASGNAGQFGSTAGQAGQYGGNTGYAAHPAVQV